MDTQSARPIIGVHLDMKGIVFRPAYIPQLMRDLASQGINAVLVEYEDIFPFDGLDVAYDPPTVWSKDAIQTLREEGRNNGIEIIPLQQCLGHLEWVFRWGRYAGFAESREYPSTLCLTDPAGKALVHDMLCQVLDAHPESRFIHLGMDEAFALQQVAARTGQGVLDIFIDYLLELIEIVERYGKTPIIWSDMLEDHFVAGRFDRIKDRVVLAPWDYATTGTRSPMGRILGHRISNAWLEEPENPAAPPIGLGARFFEDLPEEIQALIAPYRHGREIDSFFQVDLWTKLGFRVLGTTAVRDVSQDSILPNYLTHFANIRGWAQAITRNNQLGVIGSSWSRGTTFCWPTYPIDAAWPAISVLAQAMGAAPCPFFTGIPTEIVEGLAGKLSRCLKDWSIESDVCDEMEAWLPQITAHRYEWQSIIYLGRIYSLYRQANYALLEVDAFRAGHRPVTPEWQRRLDDQQRLHSELTALRAEVEPHFRQRYHGRHFTEWLDHAFAIPLERLHEAEERCQAYLSAMRDEYGW